MTSSYQGVFFEPATVRPSEVTWLKKASTDYSYLAPVLCVAALSSAFIPYFALGLAVGVVMYSITSLLGRVLPRQEDENIKDYIKFLEENPVYVSLWAPIAEEIVFRLNLQPFLIHVCVLFAPALALTSGQTHECSKNTI